MLMRKTALQALLTGALALGITLATQPLPAHAMLPPVGGGASYSTLGCSAWKQGGLVHMSQVDPSKVAHFDAVYERTCLRHSGTILYALTQWYSPHGGYHIGSIYANVQDCGTSSYGSASYVSHSSAYYGPGYASTADNIYGNLDYGTSGHSYRAKGYMSGSLTINVNWLLDDTGTSTFVKVETGCYQV